MFRYIPIIGPRGGGIEPFPPLLPREPDNGCDGYGLIIEGFGG